MDLIDLCLLKGQWVPLLINMYFVGIADDLRFKLLQLGNLMPIILTIRYSCLCSIAALQTDSSEMKIVVCSLKNSSACGADGISARILKACLNLISSSLVRVNESLHSGKFPDRLKLARTIPVYKSGEKNKTSNYRPISVLPTLAKFFERLIYRRLESFYISSMVLYQNPYNVGHSEFYYIRETFPE
jgi:hypothetical protein